MDRAYLSIEASNVKFSDNSYLFGLLAQKLPFAVEPTQRAAWDYQIKHLRELAEQLPGAHFFMEFLIPRMGRRVDLVILFKGIIYVIEYKVGASQFDRSSLEQVYGYALDLKHFHETSHSQRIVPILVATKAKESHEPHVHWDADGLAKPLKVTPNLLSAVVKHIALDINALPFPADKWIKGRYKPTPTIVEAAQALYQGHDVKEISRSESGVENLTHTADYVAEAIENAKHTHHKIICFITGVPGSGKTLAGLNIATSRQRAHSDEHAVFLSGNGPLVEVLREALALDAVTQAASKGHSSSKVEERRRASAFIQNIHHFRDEALTTDQPPVEKVVVFDEAQRAWNVEQTSKFMQQKKGQHEFSMSEPEFLLSVMDRHTDWCAIICLVGNGQEINTGEAGIEEWLRALQRFFPHWQAHLPETLTHSCSISNEVLAPSLHLATSIRSFRAERLSDFVGYVLKGDSENAQKTKETLLHYPLLITRDLPKARHWLRNKRRGNERAGLLASSNASRLKPCGIFVKSQIEPAKWFLASPNDVRSSDALEDAATEFDVQGLELDWACLCWDANLRQDTKWETWRFVGTHWSQIRDPMRQAYLINAYRVLLTRARQGLVIFVPHGDMHDFTRSPLIYDKIYNFLLTCGFQVLET
ncbi:DUF2075 domain-containing protein [Komagataeibacter swingsii]|uniref:Schlafen group 3-like DNA/RNA helicase domain-containing protein n=1 Tax=Komagataeibacter swingsii TaxID=215220 RepID=A0A2V4RJB2_9PROT|nr:DUF2075 domain-containing protein [Komagataeibacter swingsii]PYD68765.1 hypothetical protein CFR76_13430 [Komagataeibacter swingsii]GBQ54259.1 hypothetical protein AA16373_0130 [Komagataeibacter swingsii DSM 16373]